ncbi:NADH-ubiquinone oxidoreductase chain 4L [Nitrosococcus halophilus Nc 4]|uniref:NADH-ubiquinone oxidoreductase chain 4L n=1 Tax=Nitrosococcus halophilus (strain Nc4) TaxID=472759 RepID=D5C345_NITHN|nr:Na+/H+ antiporter subunit C [Nitrosococcus halophilus]ADE14937.1 NADH-ubiquinone oxidoreductase chain 4L [Nitrosococcus halophilus Nc 4]
MMLTPVLLYILTGIGLFIIGLYALLAYPHLLRKILAFNIMASGVFLVYVAAASRTPEGMPDPVPQAMVLTGIVVASASMLLGLALATRFKAITGRAELEDESPSE